MENQVMTQVEQLAELVHNDEPKTRKHPASLGKFNRMAVKATAALEANGHEAKRFKRDYVNGVASYVCPQCGAGTIIVSTEGRGKSKMEGEALNSKCAGRV